MRVTMTSTQTGYPDGFTPTTYEKGETYDVPESLGRAFVALGQATEAKPAKAGPAEKPAAPPKAKGRRKKVASPDETK